MIGFETIGNATLTVFDGKPVLTTDPWLDGKPYFGSWKHAYEIPNQQRENILNSKYVWLSMVIQIILILILFFTLKDKTFLIADHYGNRIFNDLSKQFKCIKLISNKWFEISKNVRIKSFADWNQDSCLIVESKRKTF